MKILGTAAVVIMSIFLESCAFHHYALNPPPGNTSWTPEKQSAIVLVGFKSDERIGSLQVADDIEGISLASNLFPRNELNVVAVHYRSGEKFKLIGASLLVTPASATYILSFNNTPVLDIDKPGIYYYGTFNLIGRKGSFTAKYDENVVARAKSIYPSVLSELRPSNF